MTQRCERNETKRNETKRDETRRDETNVRDAADQRAEQCGAIQIN